MPRPRSLTSTVIAAAALAVIDRDGLSALTMRAVAKELHVATMALYRYVADRDALEVLVADHILAAVDVATPSMPDWRERVTILLDRMRRVVAEHPATVPLIVRHRQSAPASVHWIEAMLAVLTEAGFAGASRVVAQRTLVAFLLGHLQSEYYGPIDGVGTAAMATLDPAEFPHLRQTAADARKMDAATEFRCGVDIVLRGLVVGD